MIRSSLENVQSRQGGTVVLCCNTLEDELKRAMSDENLDYPVVWVEAGMHNQPDRLRTHINETLARLEAERVLMALGHCGGACVGLETGDYELIVPKVDDCLSLLMGSMARRQQVSREAATYFLTAGWLRYTDNLISSFAKDAKMFGREKAEYIYKIMLKHYRRFGFIDTGAYDFEREQERTRHLAAILGIDIDRLPGDLSWLKKLLSGPWPEDDFLIIPPKSGLNLEDWNWLGHTVPQL